MENYQCLIFVVPKVTARNPKEIRSFFAETSIKSFALLPSSAVESCPLVVNLFTRNNIEILNNLHHLPFERGLQSNQVDVVEVIVTEVGETNSRGSKSPFFRLSINRDNEEVVRMLFSRDAPVYTYDAYGSNTCKAIDTKNLKIMERILTLRPNIGFRITYAGTLLHFAAGRDDEFLIKLLLKYNADINATKKGSCTALQLAVENGKINAVRLLLENGASIDARDENGGTSLLGAAIQEQAEILKLLLKNGCDVNIATYDGVTPLHAAAENGNAEMVNDLLEHGAIVNAAMTYCRTEGMTPLCLAVDEGHSKIVKRLLECGANVDAPSYDGQTVLRHAVDDENLEVIRAILDHSPDVNNKMNKSALYKSVCRDGEIADEIVKMLLQHGFTIHEQDINDSKLLHQAICKNYSKIVEQLLDYGADVNKLYRYYDSERGCFKKAVPLLTAIRYSEEDMIQLLVKYGADVNAKLSLSNIVYSASTPVDEAVENSNLNALKVLLAAKAVFQLGDEYEYPEEVLYYAIAHNCLELVEELLNAGMSVSGNQYQSTSPLVLAAENSSLEMVELLVKSGASVDSRDKRGRTALHTASIPDDNRLDIVRFLIQNNADIEARCFRDEATAIFPAVAEDRLNLVEELLKFGANIDCTDYGGGSPLHYAVTECREEIFRALLDYNFTSKKLIQKTNICKLFSITYIDTLRSQEKFEWLINSFDQSRERFTEAAEILARHVLKTKAAFPGCDAQGSKSESVNESLMAVLKDDNVLPSWYQDEFSRNNFLIDCEAEMVRMKSDRVGAPIVTYYDILTKDVKQLTCYLRNANIVETLNSKDYDKKFPIYASVISYQFLKGTRRRSLLDSAAKSFHLLFRPFKELPRTLKEDMLNYLSNKDLEVLIYACTQTDEEPS